MEEKNIHEDIKWLESQLDSKKRDLEASGGEAKEERDTVKEILRESNLQDKTSVSSLGSAISDNDAQKIAIDLAEKEHKEIIEALVNMAFTKNFISALKVAEAMKNPHILDEFHDILADNYYEKLLQLRKINP